MTFPYPADSASPERRGCNHDRRDYPSSLPPHRSTVAVRSAKALSVLVSQVGGHERGVNLGARIRTWTWAAALAYLAMLACSSQAVAQTSPVGDQPTLFIPIRHAMPFCTDGTAACFRSEDVAALGSPRHSAQEWGSILNARVNAFYAGTSYGLTRWQFRVLANPDSADGWWDAPHRLQEYRDSGIRNAPFGNFLGEAAIVRDAGETIVNRAVDRGLLTRAELARFHRLLVMDNWHRRGGQQWRPTYNTRLGMKTYTAAVVAEDSADDDALTTIWHELGHELGAPDLYGDCSRFLPMGVQDRECVGTWDFMALDWGRAHATAHTRLLLTWLTQRNVIALPFTGADREVDLPPLEVRPGPQPVLRIPLRSGATFDGYQVECRRQINGDNPPSQGLLVTRVDESSSTRYHVVRTGGIDDLVGSVLEEGERWEGPLSAVSIEHRRGAPGGGCRTLVSTRPIRGLREVLFVDRPFFRIPLDDPAIFGDPRLRIVDAKKQGLLAPGMSDQITATIHNGGLVTAQQAMAVVRVRQPFAITQACDPRPSPGRRVGLLHFGRVKPGADDTASMKFLPSGSRSASVTMTVDQKLDPATREVVDSSSLTATRNLAVLSLTGAKRNAKLTVPVSAGTCRSSAVAAELPQLPRGWTVTAVPTRLSVPKGAQRRLTLKFTAPKGVQRGTEVTIPIGFASADELPARPTAKNALPHLRSKPATGLDVIVHVR